MYRFCGGVRVGHDKLKRIRRDLADVRSTPSVTFAPSLKIARLPLERHMGC
jgi:hypothetical protein